MTERDVIDFLNVHGCVVKDDDGIHVANLYEVNGYIVVKKTSACTIGTYLSILAYLRDLGFKVK